MTERNGHPVHRGFVSAAERDWVVSETRSLARARDYEPAESDPLYKQNAWRWLVEHRSGGPLPVPSYTHFRDRWDLATVVACDLAQFGPLDAWNERPEQQGFVSAAERAAVLRNAIARANPPDVRHVAYADVLDFLVAERGGTMLAIPSYKHVRNGAWDDAIQCGPTP